MENETYRIYPFQAGGRQPKILSQNDTKVLKRYTQAEHLFYEHFFKLKETNQCFGITKYLAVYYGDKQIAIDKSVVFNQNMKQFTARQLQWVTFMKLRSFKKDRGDKYLALQNLTHQYTKPNVIDIKIGLSKVEYLLQKIVPIGANFISFNGIKIHIQPFTLKSKPKQQSKYQHSTLFSEVKESDETSFGQKQKQTTRKQELLRKIVLQKDAHDDTIESIFLSKYVTKVLQSQNERVKMLGLYFLNENKVNLSLVQKAIEDLKDLIIHFKKIGGWTFWSTSLCIFYDYASKDKLKLRLIDFERVDKQKDQTINNNKESLEGLQQILRLLILLRQQQKLCTQKSQGKKDILPSGVEQDLHYMILKTKDYYLQNYHNLEMIPDDKLQKVFP